MTDKRILCYGSVNIDEFYRLPHLIQLGETIYAGEREVFPGGKGANQAVALAKAGARVSAGGLIGPDGVFIKEYMAREGCDVEEINVASDLKTGRAVVLLCGEQKDEENPVILYGGANLTITATHAQAALVHFKAGDWILLQHEISNCWDILPLAKSRDMLIVLNPSPIDERVVKLYDLDLVDVLILNKQELDFLCTSYQLSNQSEATSAKEKADLLYRVLPKLKGLIVTLGSRGAYARFDQTSCQVEAEKVETVLDTTGAGDTFSGYFLATLMKDWDGTSAVTEETLERALHRGCKAAAICIQSTGAMNSIPHHSQLHRQT